MIALGNIIGYALAVPFASSSDRIAAWLTKRNNGIREAEMRLWVLVPVMLIAPAGLILYGFTAQKDLHWLGYFFGVGMTDFTSYFYFSFVLAYAVDSMTANTAVFNVTGHPALSIPVGWAPAADDASILLPVGMQIVAGLGQDAKALAVGHAWGSNFDWKEEGTEGTRKKDIVVNGSG